MLDLNKQEVANKSKSNKLMYIDLVTVDFDPTIAYGVKVMCLTFGQTYPYRAFGHLFSNFHFQPKL